jgi:hypothetical protein
LDLAADPKESIIHQQIRWKVTELRAPGKSQFTVMQPTLIVKQTSDNTEEIETVAVVGERHV